MKFSIVYSSRTGNTAMLAQVIQQALTAEQLAYFGAPDPQASGADVIFVGFWTDKGSCDAQTAAYLQSLRETRVFLFGTAGFGQRQEYFDQVVARVSILLPPSVSLVGGYLCQGKMPPAVRARYEAMLPQQPEQARGMIENFDRAASHPDQTDLEGLTQRVVALLKEQK